VSASHNSWTDNGVKIVGADGRKLPDDVRKRSKPRCSTS
jgi:phosphomannomutase